ncbi:VanZ like family protein [Anaerobranca californiensis DSM 14826]|jgi:VanZ family protein|uniref:VanZ like family protein n=1 Tax=Anaerobranca californiensis DSM 14826 TaxID=1120989 RepID=A0A1M6NBH2_9FIRM|nr:VanZ family protein [Anaerobranca californiensis]SHJ93029.1 VanZ like family protein [Anaerobranca californiensis DSM 14826]
MNSKNTTLISWTAVILWLVLIFYFSSQPATESAALSSSITEVVVEKAIILTPLEREDITEDLLSNIHLFIRKFAHFTVYFILGILITNAFTVTGIKGKKRLIYSLIFCVIYAITDEFHQTFVPGRSGQITDVLIDSFGSLAGIFTYIKTSHKFK